MCSLGPHTDRCSLVTLHPVGVLDVFLIKGIYAAAMAETLGYCTVSFLVVLHLLTQCELLTTGVNNDYGSNLNSCVLNHKKVLL